MNTTQVLFDVPIAAGHAATARRLGVFDDNRHRPIHRWYSFVEGYSADLVASALSEFPDAQVILDPFGGSGTTALAAAEHGHDCFFSEVNPYLAWVADVKINKARAAANSDAVADLASLAAALTHGPVPLVDSEHPLIEADRRRCFFPDGVAADALGALQLCEGCRPEIRDLAKLAVATSLIPASNMIRRTDLRKRRSGDPDPAPLLPLISDQLRVFAHDIETAGHTIAGQAVQVGSDARSLPELDPSADLIITSPPYLNGTNYCRNTKLELLALGFIPDESDLADLRLATIAAGINNISKKREDPTTMPEVEEIACRLDEVAYDQRIPAMVRMYFSDMRRVAAAVRRSSRPGATWLLDIGDSRFCGVNVPTHELLAATAALEGWLVESIEPLRTRRSYDGTELTQVLIRMKAV
ncbi:MAG: hypothetical protein F4155_12500 [Acidimicrobiales bacterium]|nr:hypothetical protein [Acidimicrobiales bacterium]MYH75607.1 hypothetical protein [Acidimicrobiales bacterium]MYK72444.1 hypothetical protein [Acidimicrobiales bacterium]